MTDLVTWLRAQLDDDERVAREAADNDGGLAWHVTHAAIGGRYTIRTPSNRPVLRAQIQDSEADENGEYNPTATFDPAATSEHASRWDPARVLAEVDAKRRVLDAYTDAVHMHRVMSETDDDGKWDWLFKEEALERVVGLLALPYANRPGYLPVWAESMIR